MAKVTIYHTEGTVTVENMPDSDAMDLVEEFHNGDEQVWTITLDDTAVSHIARAHVIRVDVD